MLKEQSAFFDYLCYQKRYNKNDNSVVYSSSNKYFLIAFFIFLLFTSIKNVSSDPISQPPAATITGPTGTWSLRAIPHQQSTSSLLSSLNENIQSLKYGCESSIDQLTRKIEMLESKIGRLDTSNQLRLEKLTESVNSKEIKDELAMEQLMRKIEANYERVNHKLSYLMDTRLDTTLNKIQTNLDNSINRLESRQSDMESEISDIGQSIDEIKSLTIKLDDKHNNTQKSVQQHLQTIISESASRDQMDKLAGTIENIGNKLNDTNYMINPSNQNQNDASGQTVSDSDRIIQVLKSEVGHEGHRIENKISNMYNELWRRFISLETTVKAVTAQSNTTRRQLQEDFRAFLQLEKQRFTEPDSQENYIEILIEALGNMVQELTRNVESNFQTVVTKQNLFIDNCHRLQLGEPQLETKISRVLERILNTVTNKTMRVDNRIVEVMEMIKSHQSQVMRNLAHSTKMIVQLTEETNENAKHLEMALFGLAERNEIVALKAQELQDDIQILTNITTMKYNIENENFYQPLNTTINNNNNNKEIQNLIQPTKPPSTSIEEKERMKNTGMKLEQIAQNAKYPETSDEVIKIFTEDENNMFENNNNNLSSTVINNNNEDDLISNEETHNTNKGKKISIILPNKYYNLIENNTGQLTYNNKLYTLLLKDILNQTGQTINIDDIGAIILNTEADGNNNKTIEENLDETNQQTYQNDLNFMNTTINDAKNFNETQTISNLNETEQKINTENNKTKQINISDLYKQRLDLYKNHKIKFNYNRNNSSPTSTNPNRNFILQNISQYQNNSTDNFTKIMQQFRKRKSKNLSKTFGVGISDEMNNNKPYDIEPIKESDVSLPSDKINEQNIKTIDDMTSLNSGETSILNTEDSTSNFDDSNIKYFRGDNTDLSNIYGGEHRDMYSDY